jgi:hypothetical protein
MRDWWIDFIAGVYVGAVATVVVTVLLSGCASHRPGDFSPAEVHWLDQNLAKGQ